MSAPAAATVWERLRAPFPADQIEKLPKPIKKENQAGVCNERSKDRNGVFCGGWHGLPAIHLDYVGHAGITMRLNEAAGPENWSWEPAHREIPTDLVMAALAAGQPEFAKYLIESAPALSTNGGMWIRLTICGVTKLGFGDAAGKTGPNAVKEVIGDALRNAAMRFGVGTYLWSKSDLAEILKSGEDPDAGTPIGQGNAPDPMTVQRARSDARKVVAAGVPAQSRPRPPAPTPPVALKTAAQASSCDDAATIRGVRKWAGEQKILEADVRSAVAAAAAALKLPDGPVTLVGWLDVCIQRVEAEGLSIDDQVRVIAEEGVPA